MDIDKENARENEQENEQAQQEARRSIDSLLGENEALRLMVADLESDRVQLEGQLISARQALQENETLRTSIRTLEEEKHGLYQQSLVVHDELDKQRQEQQSLQERVAEIDAEIEKLLRQCAEASRRKSGAAANFTDISMFSALDQHEMLALVHEMIINEAKQRNFDLTNLYVTSFRLYETLDRQEVLTAIQEVIISLVGSEQLGIFELNAAGDTLELAASFGLDTDLYARWPINKGLIGHAVRAGEIYLANQRDEVERLPEEEELTACIPLKLYDKSIGAIVIFRLLPQKAYLQASDQELFDLLATHAATALYCSGLHAKMATG